MYPKSSKKTFHLIANTVIHYRVSEQSNLERHRFREMKTTNKVQTSFACGFTVVSLRLERHFVVYEANQTSIRENVNYYTRYTNNKLFHRQ